MNRTSRGTNRRKKRIFKIIKIISLIIVIAIAGTNFTYNKVSTVPVSDVAKATVKIADIKSMQRGNNQMLKRLYGLSADEFDGVRLYYPKTNMGAEEKLIIKLKDVFKVKNWMRGYITYVLPIMVAAIFVIGLISYFGT